MRASTLIRRCRSQAGLTQAELAARLGTVQPVIARWEGGARSPSFDTVIRVTRVCGYDPVIELREWDPGEEAFLQQWLRLSPLERLRRNEDLLELERWAQRLGETGS